MNLSTIGMITMGSGATLIGGFGLLYLYDDNMAKTLFFNLSWEATKQYHKMTHDCQYYYQYVKGAVDSFEDEYFKDLRERDYEGETYNVLPSDDSDCEDLKETNENVKECEMIELNKMAEGDSVHKKTLQDKIKNENLTFLGYNLIDDTSKTTNDFTEDYIKNNNFDLMFICKKVFDETQDKKNTELLFRITEEQKEYITQNMDSTETVECIQFTTVPKQFMQIILFQGDKKYEIHEFMDRFMLLGNDILDDKFLVWYLRKFYGLQLENNYRLQIIDYNVNLFNLNETNETNKRGRFKIRLTEDTSLVETKNEPKYTYKVYDGDVIHPLRHY